MTTGEAGRLTEGSELFTFAASWTAMVLLQLVPFAPPKIDYVVDELFTRGIFSDGAAHLVDCL